METDGYVFVFAGSEHEVFQVLKRSLPPEPEEPLENSNFPERSKFLSLIHEAKETAEEFAARAAAAMVGREYELLGFPNGRLDQATRLGKFATVLSVDRQRRWGQDVAVVEVQLDDDEKPLNLSAGNLLVCVNSPFRQKYLRLRNQEYRGQQGVEVEPEEPLA